MVRNQCRRNIIIIIRINNSIASLFATNPLKSIFESLISLLYSQLLALLNFIEIFFNIAYCAEIAARRRLEQRRPNFN